MLKYKRNLRFGLVDDARKPLSMERERKREIPFGGEGQTEASILAPKDLSPFAH